jgi:hypothetical protein
MLLFFHIHHPFSTLQWLEISDVILVYDLAPYHATNFCQYSSDFFSDLAQLMCNIININ